MEFTRSSNLGSILAVALVAFLALWINQVFQRTPEDIERTLERLKTVARIAIATENDDRSPPMLLGDLELLSRTLNEFFRAHVRQPLGDLDDVEKIVHITEKTVATLEMHPDAADDQKRSGQGMAFRILFLAAEIAPVQYSEKFTESAHQFLDKEDSAAHSAGLLKSFHDFGIGRTPSNEILNAMKEYAGQQPDAPQAIDFHLLVADEMADRGHRVLARSILALGAETYTGMPGNLKLINRIIELDSGWRWAR